MQLVNTVLLMAATVQAHYHWTKAVAAGQADTEWGFVRKPKNFQSNGYVGDVNSVDIRCNQLSNAPNVATVAAGSSFGMMSEPAPYHPGPMQWYMAKAPEGTDVKTWDGSGKVWFKVASQGPTFSPGKVNWPNYGATVSFVIPKSTPSGEYLIRAEQIGLHTASTGGPQFYVACAQVKVTNGGSGTPAPLVSFPGAYGAADSGLRINLNYPIPTSYTMPGPEVWKG